MLLLFSLLFTLSRGAPLSSPAALASSVGDCALLAFRDTVSQSSNDRTIWEIVWSCLATVLACTWSALHPNIPGPDDSRWTCLKRRVIATFYALIAPEMVTLWALIQYKRAAEVMNHYNDTFAKSKRKESTILENVEQWFLGARSEISNEQGPERWTMAHGFFIQMGGFLLYDNGKPVQVLNYERLRQFIDDGTIDPPDITAEEIEDRSKGDFISKGLVVLQTSWFILQCIARWSQKLPLSELEVVTLGLALLNGITYSLWWNKPQSVGKAFRIRKKHTQKTNDIPKASVVESEKEASGSEAAESPEGGPVVQTSTSAIDHAAIPVNESNVVSLPPLSSAKDASAEAVDDDKKQNPDHVLIENSTAAAAFSEPLPVPGKVKFVRRMLTSDYSKVDGSWSSVAWFYGIMVPFRLIHYSLFVILKMVNNDFGLPEEAVRVPMFVSEPAEATLYWVALTMYCGVGTLFGGVHLIPWSSQFPTFTEQLLWRVSAVYISCFPAIIFLGNSCSSTLLKLSYMDHVGRAIVWTGAGLYGLARIILILEALLTLRNLPSSVYQDIEWTIVIPHL